jgi:hypothetical protein
MSRFTSHLSPGKSVLWFEFLLNISVSFLHLSCFFSAFAFSVLLSLKQLSLIPTTFSNRIHLSHPLPQCHVCVSHFSYHSFYFPFYLFLLADTLISSLPMMQYRVRPFRKPPPHSCHKLRSAAFCFLPFLPSSSDAHTQLQIVFPIYSSFHFLLLLSTYLPVAPSSASTPAYHLAYNILLSLRVFSLEVQLSS